MKTALVLYGHLRTFDQCWPSLHQNVIVPNNIEDIFMTTWLDSMGFFQHPESSTNHKLHPGYDLASNTVDIQGFTAILNWLKPKRIHLDNYYLHDARFDKMVTDYSAWHHPSVHHRPKGTFGQIWGRCAALKLKKQYETVNNFTYDSVICTRWDIWYNSVLDTQTLDPNYITMDGMYGPNVISDACAVGPSELLDRWGTQFDSIDELSKIGTLSLGPHEWLKAHFEYKNIPWTNRSDQVNISIKR